MTKTVATVLVVLLSGCSPPEEPMTQTSVTHTAPVARAVPVPRPSWSVRLLTGGGFSGSGKGSISMHSDGRAEAISRCSAKLSEEMQRAVDDAVISARPEAWKSRYALPKWSGLTDQFSYSFFLTIGDVTYPVSWTTESFGLVPEDLRGLHDALWAAHQELSEKCKN